MRFRLTLSTLALVCLAALSAPPAAAQEAVDLIQAFPEALTALAGEGADPYAWSVVPEAATVTDGADDLFTLEGGVPQGAPAYVDLLAFSQFGFTLPADSFEDLFGAGGTLDCERPEVSCPRYETQPKAFQDGAFVVGFQLAAEPAPTGDALFTVALLANDDDFPTFQDPRPSSPFVGTNKAWRFDVNEQGDAVTFLQVVSGPFEEFQTDARVLIEGDHGWFLIPPGEFPLTGTIGAEGVHTNEGDAADVDGEGPPISTTPVPQTGELVVQAPEPSVSESPSPSQTPTSTPTPTSTAAPTTTAGDEGAPTLLWVLIGVGLIAIVIGLILLWPLLKCWREYWAWRAAQRLCRTATEEADRAKAAAEATRAELDALRKEYPPLGFDQSDKPVVEMDNGEWISALDQALLDWGTPPVSPGQGGSRSDTQARTMRQLERLRDQYGRMKAKEAELEAKLAEAEKAATDATARAEDACAKAETAHNAYLRCMGLLPPSAPPGSEPLPPDGGTPPPEGGVGPPPPKPEPPKPEPPKPEPPKPEPPKPEPPKPEPPKPEPPKPEPPKPGPAPGGGEELPRQCQDGDSRETNVKTLVIETTRPRGRMKLTMDSDVGGVQEFEGMPVQVIRDASAWVMDNIRNRRQATLTLHIDLQMERISARCYDHQRCVNGRWGPPVRFKEVSDPEHFDKNFTHKEQLGFTELRQALNTASRDVQVAAARREELDRFCPDGLDLSR